MSLVPFPSLPPTSSTTEQFCCNLQTLNIIDYCMLGQAWPMLNVNQLSSFLPPFLRLYANHNNRAAPPAGSSTESSSTPSTAQRTSTSGAVCNMCISFVGARVLDECVRLSTGRVWQPSVAHTFCHSWRGLTCTTGGSPLLTSPRLSVGCWPSLTPMDRPLAFCMASVCVHKMRAIIAQLFPNFVV